MHDEADKLEHVISEEFEDKLPEKLCYLGQLGLYPETRVQMVGRAPFGGPLRVLVGEASQPVEHMLGAELAEHIIVTSEVDFIQSLDKNGKGE